MGDDENMKLINKVTEDVDNYINEYSQRDFKMEELEDSKMQKVKELFEDEIDFVYKVLAN
jgi:hypothetical protein